MSIAFGMTISEKASTQNMLQAPVSHYFECVDAILSAGMVSVSMCERLSDR